MVLYNRSVISYNNKVRRFLMPSELRIALVYILVGCLWILFSDYAVDRLAPALGLPILQIAWIKGLLFVTVTGTCLYALLRRDFRAQRIVEEALREREAESRYLFHQNPLPMWIYDTETLGFIDVNTAALEKYGYSREEFLSKRLTDIRPEDEVPRLKEVLSGPRRQLNYSGEWRHRLRDGTIIDVLVTSHHLVYLDRQAALVVAQDITEHKQLVAETQAKQRLEIQLENEMQLREMRARFISMVSHEFRNPLASIATSTDLLTHYSDRMTPERQQEHLGRIQRQISQLTELLDDFMIIMRAENIDHEVEQAAINLSRLCLDVVIDTQLTAGDKYTIQLHSRDDDIIVPGDEKLIKQALSNLVLNAIKYSPHGGSVDVELTNEDREAVIQVRDRGIGIPESEIPRLFTPFFRANNVGEIPGTGLGLAIAARAVEKHHGSIDVTSAVGQGTTFIMRLPQGSQSASF